MTTLNQNVGFIDRLVRGLLAVDLLALCLSSFIGGFVLFLAATLIIFFACTGATGYCPVYSALGRNSRQRTEP